MAILVYRITEEAFTRFTEEGDLRIIESGADAFLTLPRTSVANGDIATIWQPSLAYADWELDGPLLESGHNLDTALLLSLFSDRQAASDDKIPDGSNDRRGWWGDPDMGSRLWLLERAKLSQDTPLQCKNYITEALKWMLDDGVAAAINVDTALQLPMALAAQIQIYRQSGPLIARNFAWVWKGVL